jgi:hypothetical protein
MDFDFFYLRSGFSYSCPLSVFDFLKQPRHFWMFLLPNAGYGFLGIVFPGHVATVSRPLVISLFFLVTPLLSRDS